MTYSFFSRDQKDAVAIIEIKGKENEPNILKAELVIELDKLLNDLKADTSLKGVIFYSSKKDFIVGADINEISAMESFDKAREGSLGMSDVLQKITDLPFASVAVISGQCLGGGME